MASTASGPGNHIEEGDHEALGSPAGRRGRSPRAGRLPGGNVAGPAGPAVPVLAGLYRNGRLTGPRDAVPSQEQTAAALAILAALESIAPDAAKAAQHADGN